MDKGVEIVRFLDLCGFHPQVRESSQIKSQNESFVFLFVRFLGLFGWILCSGFGTCSGFRLFGLFGRFCGKIVEKFARKCAENVRKSFTLFGGKLSFAQILGQIYTYTARRWKDLQMVLHRELTAVGRRFCTFST